MHTSALRALAILSAFALACSEDRLSGPEAQAVFTEARPHLGRFGDRLIVFVDGRQVSSDDKLQALDPRQIRSIEIVKGGPGRGVIHIYTLASSDSTARSARRFWVAAEP